MSHILSMGGRDAADDAEELILLNDVPDQINKDMSYYSVPSDAAFLKYLVPFYISCNGAKPQYMWASREFETLRSASTFPAYMVSGFGLLDACLHAYATNSTLVLHPLDIILSVCYAYGNQRKKPIYNNNEELKSCTQIALKQEFTRSNLLLAMVARLARKVETFPLGKLYGLINTELSSPDPLVIRLVLGVLSYLATTRESTNLTLDQMNALFDFQKQSTEDRLMESKQQIRIGTLDVKHNPNVASRRNLSSKDANNQQVGSENSAKGDPENAAKDIAARNMATSAQRRPSKDGSGQKARNPVHAATANVVNANTSIAIRGAVDSELLAVQADAQVAERATENMTIVGDWRLMFDLAAEGNDEGNGRSDTEEDNAQPNAALSSLNPLDVLSIVSSEFIEDSAGVEANKQQKGANNSNVNWEREAAEWILRPRLPSRAYKINRESGVHSVLFKGNHRAWLELPEALQELCQFFMLENKLQGKITQIGLLLQKSRLNIDRECRNWWSKMLFRDGHFNPMPDGDYLINGWLSILLGDCVVSEYCSMTVNRLSDLKTGVKLPMLLVQQPPASNEESDDVVLDSEFGLQKTRLNYKDEYREKLANSSSNANEVPIGLFMPWRSGDALHRTSSLWRKVGGDEPLMSLPRGPRQTRNRNNMESNTVMNRMQDRDQTVQDEEVSVKLWTARRHGSAKSNSCSCCSRRSRRHQGALTEPLYNMSCLLSGTGGFCLQQPTGSIPGSDAINRICVRPLCFIDVAYEE